MNSPNFCPLLTSVPSVTKASVNIPVKGAEIQYLAKRCSRFFTL